MNRAVVQYNTKFRMLRFKFLKTIIVFTRYIATSCRLDSNPSKLLKLLIFLKQAIYAEYRYC